MSDYDSDTSTVVDMATVDTATVDIIASAKTALCAALAFLQWTEQQTLRSCHCIVIGFHGMEGHFDLDVRHNGEVIGCWRDVCVLPWFVKGDASPYDDDFYPEIVKWTSINDFNTRGVDSLFDMPTGVTLKHIAFQPAAVPVNWIPQVYVWR